MATSLVRRSLCDDPANYEDLLASLVMVKSVLECNDSGLVDADSTGKKILDKLFEFGDSDGVALWYSKDGVQEDETPLKNPTTGEIISTSANAFSCFGNLDIYFYTKDCDFDKCPWRVNINDCIREANKRVDVALGDINQIDSNGDCTIYGEPEPCTFKMLLDFYACALSPANTANPNPAGLNYEDSIIVIEGMCDILRQRVSVGRVLNKTLLTIDKCDL